ncbi:response regulator [Dongia sp.]|uniref:response regulator n=1 Tax=Dongia sp. TaxID=1977262 RepID=UPI0035AF6802
MRWVSKLRHRLLVLILLVLAPAAAVIAYDVVESRARQVGEAQQQGRQLAQSVVSSLDRVFSHVEGTLDLLARIPQVKHLVAPDCSELMAEFVRTQPRYATIIAVDKSGTTLCASNPKAIGVTAADRPWFTQAVDSRSFTVGDYAIGRVSRRPILGFAQPIMAYGDDVTGVAYASIDLAWFGEHDAAQGFPLNASFTLIERSGLVMARYPENGEWTAKSAAQTPLFAELQKVSTETDLVVQDLNGSDSFFHLVKLQRDPDTTPIFLAVGLQLDRSMAEINESMAVKVALLIGIAIAITLLSYLTSTRMISRPVQDMVALSSRIAGGDLSVRSGIAHDGSELGTLAQSLDSMARALEQNQQQLLEQQRFMRAVLDNTSEMILCFDNSGTLAFMNATARAKGLPDGPVSFKEIVASYDAILDGNMKPMAYEDVPLVRVMNGQSVNNVEVMARRSRGEPVATMLVNGQPILDEQGHRLGVVIAARDVTALRATEATLRQAQKMEAVGQLTGGVAHDFNNLLGVVIGNIDTLIPRLTKPDDIELANEALDGALRGAALTRQMLAFARRQALKPEMVDLGQHLPQLAAMLRRTLGEQIAVTTHCPDGIWPCRVDASQLDSVLLNCAINARDAMPNGGTLTIEASNVQLDAQYAAGNAEVAAGDYVRIAVTDNGQGIAPEILGRVMEPFFTTKAPGQGTGLGLSMAFGFAKQSGGHLKIYSEVSHGTTVNLYLPRAQSADRPAATETAGETVAATGRECILLVDDNEAVRKTAARQLHDLGYRVVEAANGPAALGILADGANVDLLFSDVVMPGGLSGFDLAAKVRERYPALKVLLVTGFAEAAARNNATVDRSVELMSKPYRRQELASRIRAILDNPHKPDRGQP